MFLSSANRLKEPFALSLSKGRAARFLTKTSSLKLIIAIGRATALHFDKLSVNGFYIGFRLQNSQKYPHEFSKAQGAVLTISRILIFITCAKAAKVPSLQSASVATHSRATSANEK